MFEGSRLARWYGLLGLATRRTLTRVFRTERAQTGLSVAGVGIAVALLLLVTSVGVGLSESATVRASSANYAIVPETKSSAITEVARARLGRSHDVAARLNAREEVRHAIPIRLEYLAVSAAGGEPERLLVVGVVPDRDGGIVAGLPTDALTPGDPYFANGSYDGRWTGEVVLSASAAETLNADRGTRLSFTSERADRTFEVVNVSAARSAGIGQLPVALIHLSELQAIAGGTGTDVADQILIRGTASLTKADLANVYPRTTVVARSDLFSSATESRLPIAIAIAAFVVAVVVGVLFMITTMGFQLAADRPQRAVMRAIGVSGRSRTAIVVLQVFVIVGLGGVLGILLWLGGVPAANLLTRELVGSAVVAFRPVLAGYGLGVALLIGLLTVPYLLVATWRGTRDGPSLEA